MATKVKPQDNGSVVRAELEKALQEAQQAPGKPQDNGETVQETVKHLSEFDRILAEARSKPGASEESTRIVDYKAPDGAKIKFHVKAPVSVKTWQALVAWLDAQTEKNTEGNYKRMWTATITKPGQLPEKQPFAGPAAAEYVRQYASARGLK